MINSILTLSFIVSPQVNEDLDHVTLLRKYERELRRLRAELQQKSKDLVDKRLVLQVGGVWGLGPGAGMLGWGRIAGLPSARAHAHAWGCRAVHAALCLVDLCRSLYLLAVALLLSL